MERCEEAPRCNAEPPNLKLGLEGLRELLAIEWRRLAVAERIENEGNLVFPETTIIIRDIQKLMAAIEERQAGKVQGEDDADEADDENAELEKLLGELTREATGDPFPASEA